MGHIGGSEHAYRNWSKCLVSYSDQINKQTFALIISITRNGSGCQIPLESHVISACNDLSFSNHHPSKQLYVTWQNQYHIIKQQNGFEYIEYHEFTFVPTEKLPKYPCTTSDTSACCSIGTVGHAIGIHACNFEEDIV